MLSFLNCMYVYGCVACMEVCTKHVCMCLVPTEEKRALDTLELGLQMLVSHYGGVENKLWSLISGKATSTFFCCCCSMRQGITP